MGRNELYITVPSLLRCPISLEVMKSPVSLCTGVTYDRSSIQKWLEAGHDTCPATMQLLTSKEFVPNLTLRRLLNICAQSSSGRRPDSPAVSTERATVLLEKLGAENQRCVDSLAEIAELLRCSEENRRFLMRFRGFVDAVVGVLRRKRAEIEELEMVVRVLDLIMSEDGVKEQLNRLILHSNHHGNECLSSIVLLLREGNINSKTDSVNVLESIALDKESVRKIAEKETLLPLLLDLVKSETDGALIAAVLSCLTVLTASHPVKIRLAQSGLVASLTEILSNTAGRSNGRIHEKALRVLSAISRCSEGRAAIAEDASCVGGMVDRLMKVSRAVREEAVGALWSMCCVYKDGRVKEAVARGNGLTKLLVVMQSEGEGSLRRMCGDLVRAVGVVYKGAGSLVSYDTKTTHIMPC